MIEGREKLGTLAAEFMAQFEAAEIAEGFTGHLGEVMIVAEVDIDRIDGDDEDGYTAIRTRCTNGKHWIQKGLLVGGLDRLKARIDEQREERDEED